MFLGVLVIYAICSVILSGLLGKTVDYVQAPSEDEKFIEDVEKARYRNRVRYVANHPD